MPASFWNDFLVSLEGEKEKNPIIYSLIKQLKPLDVSDEKITLSCAIPGQIPYYQRRAPQIEDYLSNFLKRRVTIDIKVVEKKKPADAPLLKFEPSMEDVFGKAGLSGKYSFANFAVSSSNQVAYAAAQSVSKDLGRTYNPLFLYGGVGVGKTHLAQAVAKKILEVDPDKKVQFCPGDHFINELVEAIRGKSTERFRRRYRNLDLFIIDDVQFLAGKNHIQEELFHTFNTIISSGGQIILTSDKPPSDIKGLEDRLRSRFSGGLIVDIQPPDFELRTAILLIKAKEKNIALDIELAKIIADQVEDTRALEGTLLSIYAKTLQDSGVIDFETIEAFFEKRAINRSGRLTPSEVVKTVCNYYNIKQSHLKGPSRAESLARPRQIVMYVLRHELKIKYEEIAYILKRKDHTTIIHGAQKISGLLMKDLNLKGEVDRIINSLRQSS